MIIKQLEERKGVRLKVKAAEREEMLKGDIYMP